MKINHFLIGVLSTFLLASCSTNDPIDSAVKTDGNLNVSVTTTTYDGKYSPRHVLAIWVESSAGTYVKTLLANAAARKQYLTNWLSSSSGNTTDAVTAATLNSHSTRTCTWDGTNVSGTTVGDGEYKVCMEFTENDGTGKYATFTFSKGTSSDTQTTASKSNFTDVSLTWTPDGL